MTGNDRRGETRYNLSDDDLAERFPCGLPASLQKPAAPRPAEKDGATRRGYENVVFIEQYRRR
jgi:hypothetical protein